MRHHEQRVTDCEYRRTVDHHSIKKSRSLSDQLTKERAGQNLSWIGRASSACKDGELPSGRREKVSFGSNFTGDDIDLARWNWTRCRGYIGFAHQTVYHARSAIFLLGVICFGGLREVEDFMHVRPAQITVNQKDAITLLREREGVICTGETLSFIGHSAGEKGNLALDFRSQKGKRRAQIAKSFRGRTLGGFHDNAVV